jgi:hypothetical protein
VVIGQFAGLGAKRQFQRMARVRQSRSGRSQFCSSGRERATGSLVIPPREQQTPEALGAYQKAEIETWWPVIKGAGIKAEE